MATELTIVGQRVKELRERAGLSQQALATAAGLSVSVVAQIEQGQRADPRLSTALAISRALSVTVDSLIGGTDATPADPAGKPPAGRGRPPKPVTEPPEQQPKKPRGRPRKET